MNASIAETSHAPPSPAAYAAEWPRGVWNLIELAMAWPRLATAPRGDGRPVMVLPGLINTDRSNFILRRFLNRIGYKAHPWGLGRNFGVKSVGGEAERLIARVEEVFEAAGNQPVTLIGISLGGMMARLVAHRRPDLVREVITISSPFAGPATATNVWRTFELLTGEKLSDPVVVTRQAEIAAPLPCPSTAIWSRSDGMVNGLICRSGSCRAIEVRSSHVGVQVKPEVLMTVAKILAPEG